MRHSKHFAERNDRSFLRSLLLSLALMLAGAGGAGAEDVIVTGSNGDGSEYTYDGFATAGGSAVASATLVGVETSAYAQAEGGWGGSAIIYFPGFAVGGAGGSANASSTATTNGAGTISSGAFALGGYGGVGDIGSGGAGGDSTASSTATANGSGGAMSNAEADGGSGGNGSYHQGTFEEPRDYAGFGGRGGDATATAFATANGGGPATAGASALGGGGGFDGFGEPMSPGYGQATSVATANDGGEASSFATATGGAGGVPYAGAPGFSGGAAATSNATANGGGSATATAIVIGGANTDLGYGGGAGGTANATTSGGGAASSSATATGGANGPAYTDAPGYSGVKGVQGTANAISSALTTNGALATAQSTAVGSSGQAKSTARTGLPQLASVVQTVTTAQVGSTATTIATTEAGGSGPAFANPGETAYAFAVGLPDRTYSAGLIGGASNVAGALLGSRDVVFGVGISGANYATDGDGASHTYSAVSTFAFSGLGSDLLLGLIDDQSTGFANGLGFQSMNFYVNVDGKQILDVTLGNLSIAESFFSDDVLDLGDYTGLIDLTLGYSLVADGSGGFGFDYAFGGAVPEPSTWAMMLIGFAGLGFAGYRRCRSICSIAPGRVGGR